MADFKITDLPENLQDKIMQIPFCDCWIWIGSRTGHNYARMRNKKKLCAAYRFIYELANGPIPEGKQLDHLCRMRPCVNPRHLEPVTGKENMWRALPFIREKNNKTHCPKGHPYEGENVIMEKNKYGYYVKRCRTCKNERVRKIGQKWRDLGFTNGRWDGVSPHPFR